MVEKALDHVIDRLDMRSMNVSSKQSLDGKLYKQFLDVPFEKPLQSKLFIHVLAALIGGYRAEFERQISRPDTCFDLVDILPAFAAAPEHVKTDQASIKTNAVINFNRAHINKPILAPMTWPEGTLANPFH